MVYEWRTGFATLGREFLRWGSCELAAGLASHTPSKVRAYVKNHSLGFEVPYRHKNENRKYRPDFIVLVDDGHGEKDLLHLVVEIKGYRGEDAKVKKLTMENFWVPGVNRRYQPDGTSGFGRWAFAEFTNVETMQSEFEEQIESHFQRMIDETLSDGPSETSSE